eukprot:scaffold488_cov142-Skeletonema_menzelii.AAC.2
MSPVRGVAEGMSHPLDDEENKLSSSTSYRSTMKLVELSLENISYAPINNALQKKGKRKTILSNISTTVSPYQLTGWMGPSGSGKTSLLSVLGGLIADPENDLSADSCIRINGEKGALPKRLIGIVHQDDLLLSNLTVKETIKFAARLKSPKHKSDEEVDKLVDETISRLGLAHVQDSLIGSPGGNGSKISGGERKRVAVAVELVARPSVLLLDEPTSSLDATSAYQLMVTLKELANLGHAIAVVIHQPRTSIFNLFDKLLLLSKGEVVFDGLPSEVRQFLESCPGVNQLPPETGKADWIMDVITDDENRDDGDALPLLWKKYNAENKQNKPESQASDSKLRQRNRIIEHAQSKNLQRRLSSLRELQDEPKFESSFVTQLKLLIIRAQRQGRGERITRLAMLLTTCWTVFTGLAWGYLPNNTDYVFNRLSLLYFILIAQSNSVVTTSMLTFGGERSLLSRERAKKMYGVLPYFIAKTMADMVNSVAMPMIYGVAVYWICNLRSTAENFFTFVLIYYLSVSAAQSFGLFLSIAIPNFSVALMLAPLLTICLIILGGFYIPFDKMGPALAWASWISPARYGFTAFVANEFDGRQIPCAPNSTSECPFPGSSVISSLGITGIWSNLWLNVGVLFAIQVFLRVVTYFLMRRSK